MIRVPRFPGKRAWTAKESAEVCRVIYNEHSPGVATNIAFGATALSRAKITAGGYGSADDFSPYFRNR